MVRFLFFLIIMAALIACQGPPINNCNSKLNAIRFEQLLYNTKGKTFDKDIRTLHKDYEGFFELYFGKVLGIKMIGNDSSAYYESVHAFINHKDINELYLACQRKFRDFTLYENEVGCALDKIGQIFPKTQPPKVYTFLSALNIASFTYKGGIGVVVDMFLGKEYDHYQQSGHPQYLINNFEPKNLSTWAIKTFLNNEFPITDIDNSSLIDHIIHQGKIFHILSLALPNKEEHDIFSYSKEQYDWCVNNEREIWVFFAERNLLYEKDKNVFFKFVSNGPNTSGMPAESPGNIGAWVGMQIVKSYLKNNPHITPEKLFSNEIKSPEFLINSNYKP